MGRTLPFHFLSVDIHRAVGVFLYIQVASIVLEWINNHFSDFETDASLTAFLEQFEALMEKQVSLM